MRKEEANMILNLLVEDAQLSKTAREKIQSHYEAITSYINNNFNESANIYIQGSVNLGTAIRPINGSQDDYDVDFVVVVPNNISDTAEILKDKIGDVLRSNKHYKLQLEEKRRAWRVNYSQSHVDIVPAKAETNDSKKIINVTKKTDTTYVFIESAPQPFANWFEAKEHGKTDLLFENVIQRSNSVKADDFPKNSKGTVLSKTVQLLKLHRDYMFQDDSNEVAPISMLITILAAQSYKDETNLVDALTSFFKEYISKFKKDSYGNITLPNPVLESENFTDKWIEHPERKVAFVNWVKQAKNDILSYEDLSPKEYLENIQKRFSNNGRNVAKSYGNYMGEMQRAGNFSYDKGNGFQIKSDSNTLIPKNTFYGS